MAKKRAPNPRPAAATITKQQVEDAIVACLRQVQGVALVDTLDECVWKESFDGRSSEEEEEFYKHFSAIILAAMKCKCRKNKFRFTLRDGELFIFLGYVTE